MLAELCRPEVPPGALLVVPVGSCEQHGPHLPLGTDTLIAEALAVAAAERMAATVVSPSIAIGASGEHRGFPGTLSIGTGALTEVAVELARSALPGPAGDTQPDFRGVLFLNAHGGNVSALTRAERTLCSEGRAVATWHMQVVDGDMHAGRTETSLMLHLRADLVRAEAAEAGQTSKAADVMDTLRTEGVRAVSPNGVLGDPRGASADEGRRIFDDLLAGVLAKLHDLDSSVQA